MEDLTISVSGSDSVEEKSGSVTVSVTRTATHETLIVNVSTLILPGVDHPIASDDITMLSDEPKTFIIGASTLTFDVAISDDNVSTGI